MIQLLRLARRRFRDRARDERSRRRRRRWAVLLVTGLIALCYVVGLTAEGAEAGTRQRAAEVAAPAQPTGCEWRVFEDPDGSRWADLRCDDGRIVQPRHLARDLWPPLPDGCREVNDDGFPKVACEDSVTPTDGEKEWVDCRDEHDFWFDDHDEVQIPEDAPQWWKDEIAIESGFWENGVPADRKDDHPYLQDDPETGANEEEQRRGLLSGDEGRGCSLAKRPPKPECSQVVIDPEPGEQGYEPPGMMPDQCWGTYPSDSYGLNWDDGGPFDFTDKMQAWTASFMYTVGKGAIVLVLWMVGWAFTFDITAYTSFATNLSKSYDSSIVGPLGLKDLVWFTLIAWCGFAALRGKMGMAGGEILFTIVVVGVMTVLLNDQTAYMNKVARLMDETSARLLVAGQAERCLPREEAPPSYRDDPPGDCRDTEVLVRSDPDYVAQMKYEVRPLQKHIHEAFVEQPYAYLNWGQIATDECLTAQNQIVGTGFNEDGWPERHMRRAGCEDLANFNTNHRDDGMLAALLTMLVALIVAFFLGLMAITVVISKFLVALLFAILPFAAVGAVLPGAGRRLAWSWFGTLLQLLAGVVLMSFLLSMLLLGVDEVLRVTNDVHIVQRWFVVLLTVGSVYFARKRLLASSKSMGEGFADSAIRLSPGGRNWGGGSQGIDLSGIDRGAKATMWGGGLAVAAGGRMIGSRLRERRVARRGYRNLERMERTRERPKLEYRYDGYRFHPTASTPAPATRATPGGGPRTTPSGNGGRSSVPPNFTRTPGGNWTGPAADWDAHNAAGPASAPPAPAPAGSAPAPVPLARERMEVVHTRRAPRSPVRHPIGHLMDRIRAGTPGIGTAAQAQRMAERAHARNLANQPRRGGLGWR